MRNTARGQGVGGTLRDVHPRSLPPAPCFGSRTTSEHLPSAAIPTNTIIFSSSLSGNGSPSARRRTMIASSRGVLFRPKECTKHIRRYVVLRGAHPSTVTVSTSRACRDESSCLLQVRSLCIPTKRHTACFGGPHHGLAVPSPDQHLSLSRPTKHMNPSLPPIETTFPPHC